MKRLAVIILLGYLCFNVQETHAFVYSYGGEKISKVADLPDTEEWLAEDGEYADLSVIHKQLWIFWIPIWNWDARYCGSTPGSLKDDKFLELEDSDQFISQYGLPEDMIPFWDRIGGKLILVLILIIFGFKSIFRNEAIVDE